MAENSSEEEKTQASTEVEAEVDLEKLRDERSIPVARGFLTDMATDLVPQNGDDANYGPLVMKFLKRTLDADLNLTTDNPYVFQLLLGFISGLNSAIIQCNTIPIDDARYGRIAKEILDIAATANISLGNIAPEQSTKEFEPVKERLNELFAREKLTWMEVKYIMDTIIGAFKQAEQTFSMNIDRALQRAEAKAMGVDHMSDLTMGGLNDFLVAPIIKKPEGDVTQAG